MTAWERVRAAMMTHDDSRVATVVSRLTLEERRDVIKELPAYQRERREAGRWTMVEQEDRMPIRLVGVGCSGGPAAATTWLFRRGVEVWSHRDGRQKEELLLARVVADRPAEWRLDLARRASARLRPGDFDWTQASNWRFVAHLLRELGAEPPADAAFVLGWIHLTAPDRLRDDPFLDTLAPLLFEADRAGRALTSVSFHPHRPTWEKELRALVGEGRLKREMLLDGCLSRFLRGGQPADLKWFVTLHDLLDPTPEEVSERARDYLRLLPTAPALVAEPALRQVCRIDEAGGLDEAAFAEAAEAVLFRPEKKLVRAALSWLGRTSRGRVDATLVALTAAFGQEALDLRERTVKLIVKLAPKAGEDALRTVREAATALPADLRERVAAVCGAVESVDAPPEPVGVAPYTPSALPAPIGSVAELAEETALLFSTRTLGPREGERLLAGLVHFAYHAPADTRAALEPVVAASEWARWMLTNAVSPLSDPSLWLCRVVGAAIQPPARGGVRGALSKAYEALRATPSGPVDPAGMPHQVLFRRIAETVELVGRTPLLLSTPTSANGQVDPAELVARLEKLEKAGLRPGHADLEQALLRLPRSIDPDTAVRARKLSSPAGQIVAHTLVSGVMPDPPVVTEEVTISRRTQRGYPSYEVVNVPTVRILATVRGDDLRGTSADLCRLPADGGRWRRKATDGFYGASSWWPSIMPSHREVIAAHLLPGMADATEYTFGEGEALLGLAEADGPAGDALATVLAYKLGARPHEDSSAAVDALLILAGRGQMPSAELGTALGRLIRHGLVKLTRIVTTLTAAADAGAAAEVWTTITTALPDVLPGDGEKARPGTPDLLALATRCAETTGARADLPELAAVAARGGSSRLVQEAKRLHGVAAT